MNGVAQLLQTIGSLIIFSLILLTTNRFILASNFQEVESEAESIAITLAQNILEEAQNKPFDANTAGGTVPAAIPEGFSSCGPGSGETRNNFNDFDDYDGYSQSVDTQLGEDSFHLSVEVSYVKESEGYSMASGSKSDYSEFKKMRITVTSDYLKNNSRTIQLTHLRPYYKTLNQ